VAIEATLFYKTYIGAISECLTPFLSSELGHFRGFESELAIPGLNAYAMILNSLN
jgi:hypothetical protein